jgi:hypothetical protein
MTYTNIGGQMENQFDFGKVMENLTTQIAQQAQQIAVLQAIIQSLVEVKEEELKLEEQEEEPADGTPRP